MECMDMEMNDEVGGNMGSSSRVKNSIHLWYLHEGQGIKTTALEELDFQQISISSLKELAVNEDKGEGSKITKDEIDILYNGTILEEKEGVTLEAMNIKPNSVLHVIKKLGSISTQNAESKTEKSSKISDGTIAELVIALKTMTLSPKFLTTIEKLSDPQTLKNEIFAVVPQIQFDPIGISIIQDVSMIFYLANEESLRALADTRPWVVEAFNLIAASIHQQEATSGSSRDGAGASNTRMPSGLSSALLSFVRQQQEEEEDEDMRDGNNQQPGTSQQQITRQQLVAALNSLSGFGILPGASPNIPPQPPTPTQRQNSTSRLTDPLSLFVPGAGTLNSNRPRSESNSAPVQPSNSQPLTGELVARAMREALSQLPAEQRNAQMNAFRNLAMSLSQQQQQQQSPSSQVPQQNQSNPSVVNNIPPISTNQTSTPVDTSRFQEERNQMRELGINDDNLALRALEETGGDLAQAIELIFSGYYSQ